MHSSIEQRQVFLWGDSFAKDKTTEDKRDPTVHPTVVYRQIYPNCTGCFDTKTKCETIGECKSKRIRLCWILEKSNWFQLHYLLHNICYLRNKKTATITQKQHSKTPFTCLISSLHSPPIDTTSSCWCSACLMVGKWHYKQSSL